MKDLLQLEVFKLFVMLKFHLICCFNVNVVPVCAFIKIYARDLESCALIDRFPIETNF